MSDKEMNEVMSAIGEIRDVAEKSGVHSPEFKELSEKTDKLLSDQEVKNQEIIANMAAETKAREAMTEQIQTLEVELARKSTASNSENYKDMPEYKALNLWAKSGFEGMDAETKSLLRSDNDVQGGYLTSSEMDNTIIRQITEVSPVRQVSRTRSVGRKTLEMPTRTSIPTAHYEGEAAPSKESNSTYGNETLTCYRLTTTSLFTMDMMLDSGFDIENEILQDVSEAFGFAEGRNFVLGDGVKKPEGFLAHAGVTANARETAASGEILGDDLILMTGDLKVGYDPLFGFNRQTLAYLRTLKGSDGQYLWQAGLAGAAPNTIAGERYVVMQDMPDHNVAGNLSVVYGDFMRGYEIIDRTGTTVIRDNLTAAPNNIVKLIFHKYNTGQVILPEAFRVLKVKA